MPQKKEVPAEPKLKHDPQEDDPQLGKIIRKARKEAQQKVLGNNPPEMGQCHQIWAEQKRILSKKGIDWKTPAELNPGVMID